MNSSRRIVVCAVAFEGALGVCGVAIAWLTGVPLAERLTLTRDVAERSLLALLPMVGLLLLVMRSASGCGDLPRRSWPTCSAPSARPAWPW